MISLVLFYLLFPSSNSAGWGGWGNEETKEVQNQLDQTNNDLARHQATGCAGAGYNGSCTGDDCKTESGCYCDVKCYYFHNCCDDITSIGCYRKCTIPLSCTQTTASIESHASTIHLSGVIPSYSNKVVCFSICIPSAFFLTVTHP